MAISEGKKKGHWEQDEFQRRQEGQKESRVGGCQSNRSKRGKEYDKAREKKEPTVMTKREADRNKKASIPGTKKLSELSPHALYLAQ